MSPKRFACLAERLLRAGVSPRRIGRLLGEIETHFADLMAELEASGLSRAESEARAEERLGSEETFIESIKARPELRSWARRWPWAAFILFPLVGFALLFASDMLLMVGTGALYNYFFGVEPGRSRVLALVFEALVLGAVWIAPIAAAGAACLLALHRRTPVLWPTIGCALIALVGAMTNASFRLGAHGFLSAGIGYPIKAPLGAVRVVTTLIAILVPFFWFTLLRLRGERAPGSAGSAIP